LTSTPPTVALGAVAPASGQPELDHGREERRFQCFVYEFEFARPFRVFDFFDHDLAQEVFGREREHLPFAARGDHRRYGRDPARDRAMKFFAFDDLAARPSDHRAIGRRVGDDARGAFVSDGVHARRVRSVDRAFRPRRDGEAPAFGRAAGGHAFLDRALVVGRGGQGRRRRRRREVVRDFDETAPLDEHALFAFDGGHDGRGRYRPRFFRRELFEHVRRVHVLGFRDFAARLDPAQHVVVEQFVAEFVEHARREILVAEDDDFACSGIDRQSARIEDRVARSDRLRLKFGFGFAVTGENPAGFGPRGSDDFAPGRFRRERVQLVRDAEAFVAAVFGGLREFFSARVGLKHVHAFQRRVDRDALDGRGGPSYFLRAEREFDRGREFIGAAFVDELLEAHLVFGFFRFHGFVEDVDAVVGRVDADRLGAEFVQRARAPRRFLAAFGARFTEARKLSVAERFRGLSGRRERGEDEPGEHGEACRPAQRSVDREPRHRAVRCRIGRAILFPTREGEV
jgi:hypothetical protein